MHDSTTTSKGGLQLLYIGIWFNLALILHMVEVAFHAPGTCIRLLDLPNRTTLYAMIIGELRVYSRLYRDFIMCISYWYNRESQQSLDIIEQSLVFIVSLVTCIPSASQHVLYMKFFISKYIYIVVVYLVIIGHS